MPTTVHEFDWPDRVVVGTVGVPGQRTFYLQVRTGKQIVSIALEKLQSAQLAEKIDEILDQLMTVDGNPFHVPASTLWSSWTMTTSTLWRNSSAPA